MLTRLRVQELPLSQPLSPEQVSRLWMWMARARNQYQQQIPREFQSLKDEDWQVLVEELNLTMMEKERHSLQ